jgi:hypothetical protein
MRIAIVGSREYPDLDDVREYVSACPADTVIISGGARGVDRTAEDTAKARGLATLVYPADWQTYGKSAGYRRNVEMIDAAEYVVAFWDGTSRGTKHSIDLAIRAGKLAALVTPEEVIVYNYVPAEREEEEAHATG